MDIITHAIVGAATGAVAGRPVLGMVAGVLPDLAIWFGKRRVYPPTLYTALHCILAPLIAALISIPIFGVTGCVVVFLAWCSHIFLDVITHGFVWSPKLFWPALPDPVFSNIQEWEWFNRSWWRGLTVALIWIVLCLSAT